MALSSSPSFLPTHDAYNLSPSHSSSLSSSLEQTPAPVTPPMCANDVYVHYDGERSLDYYDSPPSPPQTLEDQMQSAYALDNMHLAKILLLKLKGIEVTGDYDPRIAQVKDEDFSETFVPRGGLKLTEEAEQRCREGERREAERRRRVAREERLKVCEKIWESGARSYQEAKARAARKKEAETRVRRLADLEARERDRERTRAREPVHDHSKQQRRTMRTTNGVPRPILSYDTLPALHSRQQMSTSRSPPQQRETAAVAYEYTLMRPTVSVNPPTHLRSKPPSPNSAYRELTALSSTAVPFSDVVSSMQGPLFSDDDFTPCKRGKTQVEMKLLETLLESTPWEPQFTKGKARARVEEDCMACSQEFNSSSTASSSSLSSVTTVARSISWFSFSSRSSTSTAATTPSSSPMSVKVFQPLPNAARDASKAPGSSMKHSCRRVRIKRPTPVSLHLSENPLAPPTSILPLFVAHSQETHGCGRGRTMSRTMDLTRRTSSIDSTALTAGTALVARMSRSVSTFIDMAAQLQRAYVKATMYTASPDMYFSEYSSPRSRSRSQSRTRNRTRSVASELRRRERGSLRPQGYRASCDDVLTFTAVDDGASSVTPERPLIPLSNTRTLNGVSAPVDAPRVFPAPPAMPRSPFRPAHPPSCLTSRLRPIANPLLLRLRALHNVYGGAEKEVLEVREKVVGVAWEGIGRSGLVWEVKPSSL
jgi:hypothetical protein